MVLLSSLTVHCRAFSLAFFCVAIVVSVFDSFSILSGSFNSECFLWGWGWVGGGRSYTFLYPALLVVLFWFAFLSVSLLSLLFRGSPHVTSCGRVISQTNVNRW